MKINPSPSTSRQMNYDRRWLLSAAAPEASQIQSRPYAWLGGARFSSETYCNVVLRLQQCATWGQDTDMAIEIEGVRYYSATDVHEELGIARQTLWRWRQASKIPSGRRYRGYKVVFSEEEMVQIREFANRLEPPPTDTVRRHPRQGRS